MRRNSLSSRGSIGSRGSICSSGGTIDEDIEEHKNSKFFRGDFNSCIPKAHFGIFKGQINLDSVENQKLKDEYKK